MSLFDVGRLLDTLSTQSSALEEAKRAYADRLSPDFGVFDFMDTGEVFLSRLTAWLLDPDATHAQGDRFLRAFLEMLPGMDWQNETLSKCKVKCEAVTEIGRRIDICIFGDGWVVGIENKLRGAADGADQIKDYLAELKRRAPVSSRRCLVYLTLSGDLPPDHSLNKAESGEFIEHGELHTMDVTDFIKWLRICRNSCRSQRISAFIDEFIFFLDKDLRGIRDMTERDKLVEIATSQTHGPSALRLIMAAADIKKRLLLDLTQKISERCEGWTVIGPSGDGSRYENWRIQPPEFVPSGLSVCFEFGASSYNYLLYGICKDREEIEDRPDIFDLLNRELGSGKSSSWWPWYRAAGLFDAVLPIESNWSHNEAPWIEIVEGRMAERFVTFARRANDAVCAGGVFPVLSRNAQ